MSRALALRSICLALSLAFAAADSTAGANETKLREPLPFDIAAAVPLHNNRSAFDLSADGQWLAHTYSTADMLLPGTHYYSASGVPVAEGGGHRMRARLTSTRTSEFIDLGNEASSSWAASWSPDGKQVAFYSDQDAEAGVWIWDRATRKQRRIADVRARPFFGFEYLRWSSAGDRVLCKILPADMDIQQANALSVEPGQGGVESARQEQTAAVRVLRFPERDADTDRDSSASEQVRWAVADLAMLEPRSDRVVRIAERTQPRWYAFSPDDKRVAYTVWKGWVPNTQQAEFAIHVYEIASASDRTLVSAAHLEYGMEVSWSPDGRHLAYADTGQLGNGRIRILAVGSATSDRTTRQDDAPVKIGIRKHAPLWDASGRMLYSIGADEKLWRVEAASGHASVVATIPGGRMTAIVDRPGKSTIWTTNAGRVAWVVGQDRAQLRDGIYKVNLKAGDVRSFVTGNRKLQTTYNLAANDVTGEIAFVAGDQQHLDDAWIFATGNGQERQVTHLHERLDRFALGSSRLIEWRGANDQALRGTLLLPPDYQRGQRLPLVVNVYGGSRGSESINSFGINGGAAPVFNFHILATRGYAVLDPDAPLTVGASLQDLEDTVMPGIDAAIAQGYADADRLAIMGHSFGSYSALALLTRTDRFKAAILSAAIIHPDLLASYLELTPSSTDATGYFEHGQGNMGGSPWQYPQRYALNSPIFGFDRIQAPLLIGQGEKDGKLIASDATFVALRRLGKQVEYRIYRGEGHVITATANVVDFWNRRLEFLAEHLGGAGATVDTVSRRE